MNNDTNKMPYSLEAEQALLGCMLIDNEVIADILCTLSEDDFYVESHQYILSAIKQVFAVHKPVDLITVGDNLENAGTLEKVGGFSYLTDIVQSVPSTAFYKNYYEILRRDSTCRRLVRSAREITDYARGGHDETDAIRFAEDKIYGISKRNDTSAMKNIAEILPDVLNEYQERAEDKKAHCGLMTGINRLDRLTNGLQKTNLIVLAARPGIGKTTLAMNIVEHAGVVNGMVCAVFSLEMSETELTKRLISSVAEVSQRKLDVGEGDTNDWLRIVKSARQLENSKIIIDASPKVTPAEVFSKCRRIKSRHGGRLDLVMIDYIQLMRCSDKCHAENRVLEVASITRDLKIMAKELDVPVLALSQLSRMKDGEKPTLSNLRESGSIEQDADMVMFIERPDVNATDEEIQKNNIIRGAAYLEIAKNRHGGLDKIPLRFKGDITKFVNPELNEAIETRAENLKN